jgi:predicted Zn-dependent peptidase
VAVTDDSLYSLQVFTNILGGGMSSRLFQEARERRGLCYSIYSFHIPYSDTGMFGLYAGTDAADTAEQLARQMITRGRPIPVDELVEKVDAVTVDSARTAGRALIARGKMATAVLGLGSGLESAATIAETLTRRAA